MSTKAEEQPEAAPDKNEPAKCSVDECNTALRAEIALKAGKCMYHIRLQCAPERVTCSSAGCRVHLTCDANRASGKCCRHTPRDPPQKCTIAGCTTSLTSARTRRNTVCNAHRPAKASLLTHEDLCRAMESATLDE